jgi:uncharacterized lipoprotein YbaY/heat shock protein HslJ
VRAPALVALTLVLALAAGCSVIEPPRQDAGAGGAPVIEGVATYRDKIALPPHAVFEALLQDGATEIARTTLPAMGSPIRFSIAFDPAKIDSRRTYSVRARILVGGRLWLSSDTAHPVLTRGTGRTVDLALKMVTRDALVMPIAAEMVYLADAARVIECLTGRSYPVAPEGDVVKMQRAYREDVKAPGARLFVTFEGSIAERPRTDGAGLEPSIVVARFIHAWPNQHCGRAHADVSLTNTRWLINSLEGHAVGPANGRREPHLLLRAAERRPAYSATVGCNQLAGGYTLDGDRIVFSPGMSTRMACLPALDTLEKRLIQALAKARRWLITGNTLEFTDDGGAQVALFET